MQKRALVYINSIYMDLSIRTVEKLGIRLCSSSVKLQTLSSQQLNDFGNLQCVPETLNDIVLPNAA